MRKRIRLYLLKPQFGDDSRNRTDEAGSIRKLGVPALPPSLG
jgi:hypothetical protein